MIITKRIPLLLIFLFFLSCKKDKNVDYPSIQITAPAGLNTYNVFDTIKISAHVSDASGLQSVFVYLSNSLNVQVLPPAPIPITSKNMTFSVPYLLNDIHMPSNNYYITVGASNGNNISYAYQKIYVNAAPAKRVAVYAMTRSGKTTQVLKLDSVLHPSTGFSENGNFTSSDVNSYYQQLYISPYDTGNVSAVAVPAGSLAWNVLGFNSGGPYFTNVYSYGDAVYVSMYSGSSGFVNYYSHLGVLQTQVTVNANYYPIKALVWDSYLFVEEKNIASSSENLVLYHQSTGGGFQQKGLPGPLVGMFGMDNDDIFIFGNTPTDTPYMFQYKISTNVLYSPILLPSAKLLSAMQLDQNTYLVGFANNIVYQYTFNPNGLMPYINGITASHIRYDAVNNAVLIASGKVVNQYSYTNAALMYSTPLADSVLDIQILYNK